MKFTKWLDLYIKEKDIDVEDLFTIVKDGEEHVFDYGYVIEAIKSTCKSEQEQIKRTLVQIDFRNGDAKDFLRYLAQALC